jgi:adenosine deaminase
MRVALVLVAAAGCAQGLDAPSPDGTGGKADDFDSDEASERAEAVADLLEGVRDDAPALREWLAPLPKGADLHSHLSGAIETESLITWGGLDGICVNAEATAQATCTSTTRSLTGIAPSDPLWVEVLQAWSLEGKESAPVVDRHSHFFAAFGKFFQATKRRSVDLVVEARRIAARDGVAYVELMVPLGSFTGGRVGQRHLQVGGAWDDARLAAGRTAILADSEIATQIGRTRAELDTWERGVDEALGCGGAQPDAACDVEVRYLMQATRVQPRESVFGQFVYGFALAAADSRVVGLNLVQAEEDPLSLASYRDHMKAIGFLTAASPEINVALHAGELTEELATAEHRAFHVREAVEVAGARRIGHAVDVLEETDADALVQHMAQRGVLVEACLTSNQQLLDVEGDAHPVNELLQRGVPVALATDDQGILRTSMTDELVRAVSRQGLTYQQLKRMIRASVAHTFLPGTPLRELAACKDALRKEALDAACQAALERSERAALEWKVEAALDEFERDLVD